MAVLATARVGREFRVTLPREVRGCLKLDEGDEIVFYTIQGERGRVCIRKGA